MPKLASKFEERVKQCIVGIMKVYKDNVQDMYEYIQWPEINLQSEQPVPFSFFQKLEDKYEAVKVEVLARLVISKEYFQDLLIRPTKKVTKFNAFVRNFKQRRKLLMNVILALISRRNMFSMQENK